MARLSVRPLPRGDGSGMGDEQTVFPDADSTLFEIKRDAAAEYADEKDV